MRAFVRVAAVAAAAGLFLAPAADAASAARIGPAAASAVQVPIKSGTTRITTIRGIPNLLLANQVVAFATDPATETLTDGTAVFQKPPTRPHSGLPSRSAAVGSGRPHSAATSTIAVASCSLTSATAGRC